MEIKSQRVTSYQLANFDSAPLNTIHWIVLGMEDAIRIRIFLWWGSRFGIVWASNDGGSLTDICFLFDDCWIAVVSSDY